jgi:ribosomal-protein-alanine N-acetyltransferase
MRREDTAQVAEIDREAFPSIWPQANYEREFKNPIAHYIVACDDGRTAPEMKAQAVPKKGLSLVISRARELFNRNRSSATELHRSSRQYIAGFTGLWIMADEAHITNIAVRESYQRQGLGELLLISAIDLAVGLKTNIMTLEVRASNTIAQALYRKYGFNEVGLRHNYYADDKEDAKLMSTEDINSASFQSHLQRLKQAHSRKLGITLQQIAR